MTTPEGTEGIERELVKLPVRDVDPEGARRIRVRCLEALARSQPRRGARDETSVPWRVRLEALAATGLGALFIAAAVERAFEVFR